MVRDVGEPFESTTKELLERKGFSFLGESEEGGGWVSLLDINRAGKLPRWVGFREAWREG